MQSVVGVVVPPFTINIDEFTLAFQEVGMMLGLPTNTITIVGKCSIVWIPISNDSTVASERTQIHDCNCSYRIETRCVHGFIQSSVNACFRTCIGEPSNRVGIIRTRQGSFSPIGSVEHSLIVKSSVWPSSRNLFIISEEQLPSILWKCNLLDAIGIGCRPSNIHVICNTSRSVKDDSSPICGSNQQIILV